jgi:hypothetical protein
MTEPIEAFPLCWPAGRPRSKWREQARFKTTFGKARDNCRGEIQLLGGTNMIISTNIPLKRDGLPYADHRSNVSDTGVAVYFTYKKRQMCFACDRWYRIEDNMHAIGLTIGALRGIARWGTGDMMEAAFTGFEALPPPGQTSGRGWREILGFPPDRTPPASEVESNYRFLRSKHHPDKGGSAEEFNAVQRAVEQARDELSR